MRRNTLLTALGGAAAAAACGIAVPALNAGPGDYDLPDLVSTAPPVSTAYLMEGSFVHNADGSVEQGAEGRLLLRFDGYVNNEGDGPVDFQGTPKNRNMTQYVQPSGGGPMVSAGIAQPSYGGPLDNQAEHNAACITRAGSAKPLNGPCFIYSTTDSEAASDGHNHWHMVGAAEYSLWNEAGTAEIGDGQKVGFCLQDSEFIPNRGFTELTTSQKYGEGVPYSMSFCNQNNQAGDNLLREGIHPGYRDLYGSNLAWQWIDVSDV
ncbi:MAG: hypothetical protein KDC33_05180, partial [Thermoleophilia bacterium]|nr:hypothetical protein [Thermoleophilia bacterium]